MVETILDVVKKTKDLTVFIVATAAAVGMMVKSQPDKVPDQISSLTQEDANLRRADSIIVADLRKQDIELETLRRGQEDLMRAQCEAYKENGTILAILRCDRFKR